MAKSTSLIFTVERCSPELVPPANPTPYELKTLSVLDDHKANRFHISNFNFYRNVAGMEVRNPAKVIKDAIAKALVFYYPFAGRLREQANGRLVVECTGEGVLFVEAKANVRLQQFGDGDGDGDVLQPPFPGTDLLYDVPGSGDILGSPLLLIQVTRLLCGGFIVGYCVNHVMCDAAGLVQFMTTVGEMACRVSIPSVQPVWNRELLTARNPPKISCIHHVYKEMHDTKGKLPDLNDNVIDRSFFFSLREIASLRNYMSPHLHKCSIFDILVACLWRCRTIALNFHPEDEIRIQCLVNVRSKFNPPLPVGYYGNALVIAVALSTAGELCKNSLEYAVELIKRAKDDVTEEFVRSSIDHIAKYGRLPVMDERVYLVSDVRHAGFKEIDFGWGKAVYGGPTKLALPGSFLLPSKDSKGNDGIVVIINLPEAVKERFVIEMNKMVREPKSANHRSIVSPL